MNIGDRVGAVRNANQSEVFLFGYGVYEGDLPPFEDTPEYTNPSLKLDDGETIWGYECWWGPEEKIKAMIAGRIVTMVSVKDSRSEV